MTNFNCESPRTRRGLVDAGLHLPFDDKLHPAGQGQSGRLLPNLKATLQNPWTRPPPWPRPRSARPTAATPYLSKRRSTTPRPARARAYTRVPSPWLQETAASRSEAERTIITIAMRRPTNTYSSVIRPRSTRLAGASIDKAKILRTAIKQSGGSSRRLPLSAGIVYPVPQDKQRR